MITTDPTLPAVRMDEKYLHDLNWRLTIILRDMAKEINKLSGATWNGNHPVLGQYHIWVDSTGDLRIKNSPPTTETDGTIVGTQT